MNNPKYLFWCDLETSGLDPGCNQILELAWILTEFQFPYLEIQRNSYLIENNYVGGIINTNTFSDFILNMHTQNGLIKDLEENPLKSIEKDVLPELLSLSKYWPFAKDSPKSEKIMFAGHSCHFDLNFLRNHMTTFARRLSHRCFDVSALSAVARSLGMPPLEHVEAHRAMPDIEGAIDHARKCCAWLLSLGPIAQNPIKENKE